MAFPSKFKYRKPLDPKVGIKSSLKGVRTTIASLYVIFIANKKTAECKYCVDAGDGKLKLEEGLAAAINTNFPKNDIVGLVGKSPLFEAQYEHILVFVSLIYSLGTIRFNDKRSDSAERTGGKRFPKTLSFSANMLILDNLLSSENKDSINEFLVNWLNNKPSSNHELEKRITLTLQIFSEPTTYKWRIKEGDDLILQNENIYDVLKNYEDSVDMENVDELVGPFRILKSAYDQHMNPFLKTSSRSIAIEPTVDIADFQNYKEMVATSLDIRNIDFSVLDGAQKQSSNSAKEESPKDALQQIFYGAPGTGKSFGINDKTDGEVFRTTFHPDSDYSTFVGAYKPSVGKTRKMSDGSYIIDSNEHEEADTITYKFVGQSFFKAYTKAWENKLKGSDEKVYLVIEEINRGNCAQIFGDLFQLLDRGEDGNSCYPIVPDEDLGTEIGNILRKKECNIDLNELIVKDCKFEEVREGTKLLLPDNLYIWATMNTSDQSLFPIDSAFKRRWDWVYTPIEVPEEDVFKNREIVVDDEYSVNWGDFMTAINKRIYKATNSEDKQLGFFFCRPKKKEDPIDAKTFVGKVVFYLWQDVFKMTSNQKSVFNFNGRMHTFPEFYTGKQTVDTQLVKDFIQSIMADSDKPKEQT